MRLFKHVKEVSMSNFSSALKGIRLSAALLAAAAFIQAGWPCLEAAENALPYPYNKIEVLPFDGTSHFGPRQAAGLSYLINNHNIATVVEVGSFLGASSRFIADSLPENGKVYSVDHWLGNEEWKNQPDFQQQQDLYFKKFLSNAIHTGLYNKIIPLRMTGVAAASYITETPDLVFLDGSHDYESVYADITAWYPRIANHGILSGDDYNWGAGRPVKKAVDQYAAEHNLQVKVIEGWFWYYE